MRKPPAESLLAKLMAHSLMAHTSALPLLECGSHKRTGVVVVFEEEQQCKPLATLRHLPVLVSSVQRMGQSNRLEVREGSAGNHTPVVSTASAVVKTVAMGHSSVEGISATMTPLTQMSMKGTVVLHTAMIYHPS